jgi:azurin
MKAEFRIFNIAINFRMPKAVLNKAVFNKAASMLLMMKMALMLLMTLTLTLPLASCTKRADQKIPTPIKLESIITIGSQGESLAFDKYDLFVKAGDKITLTFRNNSTTLAHNWVLTKPGKADEVGVAGIKAGPVKNNVPDGSSASSNDVLASTRLVPPKGQKFLDNQSDISTGETTITFTAPNGGDYPYICSNMGHHVVMKGMLHAK